MQQPIRQRRILRSARKKKRHMLQFAVGLDKAKISKNKHNFKRKQVPLMEEVMNQSCARGIRCKIPKPELGAFRVYAAQNI
ncbi:MAG: hypothetical protein ACLU3I_22405 [Acutalibacteraceae bacterium]